jgi:hypothetical protein
MSRDTPREHKVVLRPTLSFLATLAFVSTFLVVRTFTTFYPGVIVQQAGIHFHHFWYGLAMIATAGWLAIAWRRSDRLDQVYAIVYGVGAGLIGDEIGLLLTFGNYLSPLTFDFFIGAVSIIILTDLLLRYREALTKDIQGLSVGMLLTYLGIFVVGLSSIFFASSALELGGAVAALAIALILVGVGHHRRKSRST